MIIFYLPLFVNVSYNMLGFLVPFMAFGLSLSTHMLRQWFKYGLVGLLVMFFMYAGTGLNVARYCCALCAEYGVDHIGHTSCNEIHKHADLSSTRSHMCDCDAKQTCDCCKLYRFVMDEGFTQEFQSTPDIVKVQLLERIHCTLCSLFVYLPVEPDVFSDDIGSFLSSVLSDGRNVLSRHCVLLI